VVEKIIVSLIILYIAWAQVWYRWSQLCREVKRRRILVQRSEPYLEVKELPYCVGRLTRRGRESKGEAVWHRR
jgi:hypothetical protein